MATDVQTRTESPNTAPPHIASSDVLVDPLASMDTTDAVQMDDAGAFNGDTAFGADWKKGQGKEPASAGPATTQVKAEWKGGGA